MDAEVLTIREEALRRKDKEVLKREEYIADQTDQLRHMRASMEAQISELAARELVMNDAEVKHGSLLQREELLSRRLREVAEREESLKERLLEAGRREAEMHEKIKAKQREYDQKLFPLAAREQELFRREQEAKALDADLDGRLKAFNKRIAIEEEKDRAKEKSLRDLESKAKDLLALAEKKQTEADQFAQHLQEKQRLVKAEQVEVDSRDREVKWRDEQLRLALMEHNDVKLKLANWEKSMSVREEDLHVATAALELKKAEVGVRELTVAERLTRLLDAEKDIQDRETRATDACRNAEASVALAAQRAATLQERERRIAEQSLELATLSVQLKEHDTRLRSDSVGLEQTRRQQDEKEKAIKEWILELQFREQSLAGGGGANSTPGTGGGGGDAGPAGPTTHFSSGILKMQLDDVQSAYMGAVAKRSKTTDSRKELQRRPVDMAALPPDGFDRRLQAAAATCELEAHARRIERAFADASARVYCLPDERKAAIFAAGERTILNGHLYTAATKADELQFLSVVLLGGQKAPTAAGKLTHALASFGEGFGVGQWLAYYNIVREAAVARRGQVIAARGAAMQDFTDAVLGKAAAFPEELGPRTDRRAVFGEPPVGRIRNRDLSKTLPLGRVKPAQRQQLPLGDKSCGSQQQQSSEAAAAARGTDDDSSGRDDDAAIATGKMQSTGAKAGGSAGAAAATGSSPALLVSVQERDRLIAALPSYLRKHYL